MNPSRGARADGGDSAFALFAVLSFLLMSAAVATPFLTGARTKALIARNVTAELKDRLMARGLITIASHRYFDLARMPDAYSPREVGCRTTSANILFTFQNHAGLVDLNAAASDLLAIGFQAIGANAQQAEALAETAVRFRSAEPVQDTATSSTVRGGYKHGAFESVSELTDFTNTEGVDLAEADLAFTVHSGVGTVSLDKASPSVVAVLNQRPPASSYFVVQGSLPGVPVTVDVQVWRGDRPKLSASGVVRVGDLGSGLSFVSPIRIEYEPAGSTREEEQENCEAFFGVPLAAAVSTLTGDRP